MRIALISSSLRHGGVERIFVRLAKAFSTNGHTVTLVTLDGAHSDDYVIPIGVQRVSLNLLGESGNLGMAIFNNVRRMRGLRAELQRLAPDVVISGLGETNVLTVLATTGMRIRIIISEHNDPQAFPLNRAWDFLRRHTYPRATRLVCVSTGICDYFDWIPPHQRIVIPNAVDLNELRLRSNVPPGFPIIDSHTIVAMGRLVFVKGFDLLLRSFGEIAATYPDWRLVIIGEGEERTALTNLIQELDLSERAFLPGFLKAPHSYIEPAAFLAFPSRTEGFGLALVEAFSCGLPVIAFDCPVGPRDIVHHQVNGYLIPPGDVKRFTNAMVTLIDDTEKRAAMANAALQSTRNFELGVVASQWEQLFTETIISSRDGDGIDNVTEGQEAA